MPSPHPRLRRGGEHLLDQMRHVRDWAPPGLALGGGFRGAPLGEEFGSCHRPGASLVAVAWATKGAEGADPRGGGTPTCQGGGRARLPIHGRVGR